MQQQLRAWLVDERGCGVWRGFPTN